MDTATFTRFNLVRHFRRGHKFFTDGERPGWLAVADQSGDYPNETDDGVLWLSRVQMGDDGGCNLVVFDEQGMEFFSPCESDEFKWAYDYLNRGRRIRA